MNHYLVGLIAYHSDQFSEEPMKAFLRSRHGAILSLFLGQRFWTIQTDEKLESLAHQWAMTATHLDRGLVVALGSNALGGAPEDQQKVIEAATAGKDWFPGGLPNG